MQNRRIISIVLFVLAVVLFLLMGLAYKELWAWVIGALLAACFIVAGVFFWRRGK
jgi:O-antigen/teichoic acid export membrane protein